MQFDKWTDGNLSGFAGGERRKKKNVQGLYRVCTCKHFVAEWTNLQSREVNPFSSLEMLTAVLASEPEHSLWLLRTTNLNQSLNISGAWMDPKITGTSLWVTSRPLTHQVQLMYCTTNLIR
jgi:hypothetical protein